MTRKRFKNAVALLFVLLWVIAWATIILTRPSHAAPKHINPFYASYCSKGHCLKPGRFISFYLLQLRRMRGQG